MKSCEVLLSAVKSCSVLFKALSFLPAEAPTDDAGEDCVDLPAGPTCRRAGQLKSKAVRAGSADKDWP